MAKAGLDVDERQLRALESLASARNLPVEEVLRQATYGCLWKEDISGAGKFRSGREDISP